MEGSLRIRCLRFIMACGWKLARHRFSFSGSLPSSVDRELACRWMLNGARQRALRRTGSTRTDGKRLVRRLTETVLSSRTSRALREQRRVSAERPRRWGGDGKQLDNPGYLGGTLTGRHTLVRVSMALGRIAGCNDAHLFSSIQRRVRDTTHLEEYRDLDGWHEGHSFKGCHSCLGSISQRTERIGSRRGRRLAGCYAWSTLPADVV